MKMCEEMIKLRKLLTEHNIEWHDVSVIANEKVIDMLVNNFGQERQYCDTTIYRTHFDANGSQYSVISGFGTYGGFDPVENKDYGLLECMIDDNDPKGWLTADDIIKLINGENE